MRRLLLALLAGLAASLYVIGVQVGLKNPMIPDFAIFHTTAKATVQGGDLYERTPVTRFKPQLDLNNQREIPRRHPNLNPPVMAVMAAPLGHLDYQPAYLLFSGLSLACGLAVVALLAETLAPG
ncbi:MAG: DUF2029 domain-containing protein, partial [Rhodospirillales bacterium]|nr:DUF2029 domain-containing protein [Rhodospirillales bacterium]